MLIGYANRLRTAALTAGSAASGLGPTNLQSDQGDAASSWQTAAGVLAPGDGAWLQADTGSAVTWRAVSIHRSNLTAAASLRVMLGSTAGGTDVVDETITGLAAGYGQMILALGADVTARHLRIEITDAANADGFLRIALAYGGPAWEPEEGMQIGSAAGRDARVNEVETRGGQEFTERRFTRRTWGLSMRAYSDDEMWDGVMELARASERGGNVLLIPFPDGAEIQRETVFGRLRVGPELTYGDYPMRDWRATVTERL